MIRIRPSNFIVFCLMGLFTWWIVSNSYYYSWGSQCTFNTTKVAIWNNPSRVRNRSSRKQLPAQPTQPTQPMQPAQPAQLAQAAQTTQPHSPHSLHHFLCSLLCSLRFAACVCEIFCTHVRTPCKIWHGISMSKVALFIFDMDDMEMFDMELHVKLVWHGNSMSNLKLAIFKRFKNSLTWTFHVKCEIHAFRNSIWHGNSMSKL